MSRAINITRIKAVANALAALKQEVVFVGGATVSLYTDAATSPEVRPTEDVDVVIELASYSELPALEEKLRALGFANDTTSPVICRYQIKGITVDIMPTLPDIMGFSNQWYPEGFAYAETIDLEGQPVKIFALPYFLATKLEAFKGRGKKDFWGSSDFEDIVYVLENSKNWMETLFQTSGPVKEYLKHEFAAMLADPDFEEGLYAHLERQTAAIKSREILEKLKSFAA